MSQEELNDRLAKRASQQNGSKPPPMGKCYCFVTFICELGVEVLNLRFLEFRVQFQTAKTAPNTSQLIDIVTQPP